MISLFFPPKTDFRVPVLSTDGNLVGVVSIEDLIRCLQATILPLLYPST